MRRLSLGACALTPCRYYSVVSFRFGVRSPFFTSIANLHWKKETRNGSMRMRKSADTFSVMGAGHIRSRSMHLEMFALRRAERMPCAYNTSRTASLDVYAASHDSKMLANVAWKIFRTKTPFSILSLGALCRHSNHTESYHNSTFKKTTVTTIRAKSSSCQSGTKAILHLRPPSWQSTCSCVNTCPQTSAADAPRPRTWAGPPSST